MPKEYARLWLRITNVRVERVQEISTKDIRAEGAWSAAISMSRDDMPIDAWIDLWDSLNAKRGYSWESNPWVWVIGFERYEKTND